MNKSSLSLKSELKKTDMFDQEKIVTEFNWFFANVSPMLTKQILESKKYIWKSSS